MENIAAVVCENNDKLPSKIYCFRTNKSAKIIWGDEMC
jgi:hypothetical protein